jgi:hypothetical protein
LILQTVFAEDGYENSAQYANILGDKQIVRLRRFLMSLELKQSLSQWILPSLEITGTVIIGVVVYLLNGDSTLGLLVGFVSLCSIELLKTRLEISKIAKQYHSLVSWLQAIEPVDEFSELALIYGLKGFENSQRNTISVQKDDILTFWKNCMSRTQHNWQVISYSRHDETWALGWMKYGNAIQKERLLSGCNITRVFVVDSLEEKKEFELTMKEQSKINIDISWVLKEKLLENKIAREAFEFIKSLDVAVIDNTWVYMTYCDANRRLTSASATKDKEILKRAKVIVDEAIEMGNKNKVQETIALSA